MTADELRDLFGRLSTEYLEFARIEKPMHRRPDICAFLMLDAAFEKRNALGSFSDMVIAAGHDEIFLDIRPEELAQVATPDMVRDLVRCGVRYSGEHDCLTMFA